MVIAYPTVPLLAQAGNSASNSWTHGDVLSGIGILVSVLGFGVGIWQLRRAANASEATRDAIIRTEKRMALSYLMVLVPQFRLLETEIERAAVENDRPNAIRALGSWSHLVSEVLNMSHMLGTDSDAERSLMTQLDATRSLAAAAKGQLIDSDTRLVKSATKEFRSALVGVSTYLDGVVFRAQQGA